jgi:hypothetical protein
MKSVLDLAAFGVLAVQLLAAQGRGADGSRWVSVACRRDDQIFVGLLGRFVAHDVTGSE